jgi:outer membrane protein TolC
MTKKTTYVTYWIRKGRELAIDLIGSNILANSKLKDKINTGGIDIAYLKFYPGYEPRNGKMGKVDSVIIEMEKENYFDIELKANSLDVSFPNLFIAKQAIKEKKELIKVGIQIPEQFSFMPEKRKGPVTKKEFEEALLGWEPLLELGIENYRPLEVAQKQMELAQIKLREARRQLFPTAVIRWTNTSGTTVEDVGIFSKSYEMELEQPITYGGELKFKIDQAKINLKLAEAEFKRLRSDFALELKRNYYNVILNRMNWGVFNQLIREAKKHLALAKILYNKNLITELEYQQIQSLNEQIKFLFVSSQKELSLAELTLRQTLNLPADQKLKLVNWLPFQKVNIDLDSCMKAALKNRTELKITDLVTHFNILNEQIAKAKNRLRLSLTGKMGRMAEDYSSEPVVFRDSWYVGLKFTKPIGANTLNTSIAKQKVPVGSFRAGESNKSTTTSVEFSVLDRLGALSDEKAAKVELLKSVNESAETEETVVSDVEKAYANYISSLFQIETSLKRMGFLQNRIKVTEAKFMVGEATLPDVLQAKYDLANEKVTYDRAIIGYYVALSSLSKACGVYSYLELATEKPIITAWEKFSKNPPINVEYMPYKLKILQQEKKSKGEKQVKYQETKLMGQIIGVNNDYGIVIVNLGSKQGVMPQDKLLVSRNKEEIATLIPTKIEKNITACNIREGRDLRKIGLIIGDIVEVRR